MKNLHLVELIHVFIVLLQKLWRLYTVNAYLEIKTRKVNPWRLWGWVINSFIKTQYLLFPPFFKRHLKNSSGSDKLYLGFKQKYRLPQNNFTWYTWLFQRLVSKKWSQKNFQNLFFFLKIFLGCLYLVPYVCVDFFSLL